MSYLVNLPRLRGVRDAVEKKHNRTKQPAMMIAEKVKFQLEIPLNSSRVSCTIASAPLLVWPNGFVTT